MSYLSTGFFGIQSLNLTSPGSKSQDVPIKLSAEQSGAVLRQAKEIKTAAEATATEAAAAVAASSTRLKIVIGVGVIAAAGGLYFWKRRKR